MTRRSLPTLQYVHPDIIIFKGVGIVLITVSGIAWRLTASDAPSCRAMLGLTGYEEDYNNGRFLSRPQVTSNTTFGGATRPQHPYAGLFVCF